MEGLSPIGLVLHFIGTFIFTALVGISCLWLALRWVDWMTMEREERQKWKRFLEQKKRRGFVTPALKLVNDYLDQQAEEEQT